MKTNDRSPESRSNSLRRVLPWVVVGALVLGVLAVMPSVWALPQQAPDFQTVPTLTPTRPAGATATPTRPAGATATPDRARRAYRYSCTWCYSDRDTWRRHTDCDAWHCYSDRHSDRRANPFRNPHPIGNSSGTHWAERLLDSAHAWC